MRSYKNLYVNGCSFTAGDNVKKGSTWPEVLAEITNMTLHQDAKNGNSMETIFNVTLNNLMDFSPEDTLVIIGQTWKERYSIAYKNALVNITPADLGVNKTSFLEKLSTFRRITSTTAKTKFELNEVSHGIANNTTEFENFNKTLESYTKFYENLTAYDDNLQYNQALFHFNYLFSLQNFLKLYKYDYFVIDFQGYFSNEPGVLRKLNQISTYKQIDKSRIIPMQWKDFRASKTSTSHPTEEDCKVIAKLIKERL